MERERSIGIIKLFSKWAEWEYIDLFTIGLGWGGALRRSAEQER